jgi:glycosyltransferase involved in cell wall biosynthesis
MSRGPSAVDGAGDGPPLSAAFVSPGWPPDAFANGIIPYIANIADEMRRAGHRVSIVAEFTQGELGEDVSDAHPSRRPPNLAARAVDYLAYRASSELGERRQAVRALIGECRRLVEERGVQVVEMEESYGRARWLRRALAVPVVVRLHGPWFLNGPLRGAVDDARFRDRVRLEKEAILAADAITAPSLDVLERTRAYYGLKLERAEVIPNPTQIIPAGARWDLDGCEAGTIVFIGRFDRHKGGDLVIDAFAEVARRRPSARLIFAGPDSGYFDDAGRRRTIQDYLAGTLPEEALNRVRWLGAQPSGSLPDLRRKGAVVVVGSRYDNFPFTVLEAMAAGCPLVAPRVGGIPEVVVDGVNGLLYRAGDPADMAEKLCRALDDRDLAVRLGRRAGADCEREHHPAARARQVAGFFGQVIDRKAGRPARGRARG